MTNAPIETEVKFRAPDLSALRHELLARGATISEPRHLERNTLFDDAGRSLTARGMLLRLRSAVDTVITLKTPAPPDAQSAQHKRRVEIETTVGDHAAAFAILTALGYTPLWRYEKYRESFRLDETTVVLDHTPIGDFVEIEGAPDAIRPVAERLGFDWSERNLKTYRELYVEMRGTDQGNMVFEVGR